MGLFMDIYVKLINTKRSSLPAGAEVNDYALTALTKCFVCHTEHRMHVLRLCEPPDSLQVLSTELKLITLFFASCCALTPSDSQHSSLITKLSINISH